MGIIFGNVKVSIHLLRGSAFLLRNCILTQEMCHEIKGIIIFVVMMPDERPKVYLGV